MKSISKELKEFDIRSALSGWGFTLRGFVENSQGEWWLLGQLLLLAAHFLRPWPVLYDLNPYFIFVAKFLGLFFFLAGSYRAVKALLSLGNSLSPLPEPKSGAKLVREGAYQYCRHPLYQSLLLSSFGVFLFSTSLLHLFLLISLAFLLKGKAMKEESRMKSVYSAYQSYMYETPAIFSGFLFLDWRD